MEKRKERRKKQFQKKVLGANNSLKATREILQRQVEESRHLEDELDNFEHYSRKNSLEIHGVLQDAYAPTEHEVIKVAEALNVTLQRPFAQPIAWYVHIIYNTTSLPFFLPLLTIPYFVF